MPEEGIPFVPHNKILSYEEIYRLAKLFVELGIRKVRLTGGEPFVRKGIINLLKDLKLISGLESLNITTNGLLLGDHINDLKNLEINGINLSLDTLQNDRFNKVTRRDGLQKVLEAIDKTIEAGIPLKINSVIQESFNFDELHKIALFAKDQPIEVRFIEQMPFNGIHTKSSLQTGAENIYRELQKHFPSIKKISGKHNSTAELYSIDGFKGSVGIIAGYSRTFCSTCSRVRVSASGGLQTCLYGSEVLNLKSLLENNINDSQVKDLIRVAINNRAADGFETEKLNKIDNYNSMATIGG